MSKAITFFRNRRQEAGHIYEFRIENHPQTYRFFVFSWKPLEEKLTKSRDLPKDSGGSVQPEADKIRAALLRGQGGVIAVIHGDNRSRFLWTIPVGSQSESAFGSVGILLPGHPSLKLEPLIEGKGSLFPSGAHALIPVDKEAEESLRGFQDYLKHLPSDLETLVLHALRDPNLDTRVGLLEAIVRTEATEPSANKSLFLRLFPFLAKVPRFRRWFEKPMPVWPVVVVFLSLLLAVNASLSYSILQSVNGTFVIPGMPQRTIGNEDDSTVGPSQKIFALIEASRKSSNPSLKILSQDHFTRVQKEEDLKTILVLGADGALVVRGLMKLEAIRLDKEAAGGLFGVPDNHTQVNKFYSDRKLDEKSRDMLAALACAAFGSPGLPETQSAAAVPFADGEQDCKGFPLDKVSPGLDELLKLVQEAN